MRIDIDLMRSVIEDIILFAKQKDNLSLEQIAKAMTWKKNNHEREFREALIVEVQTKPELEPWARSIYFDSFKHTLLTVNCSGLTENINSVFHELIEEEREEALNIKHNNRR